MKPRDAFVLGSNPLFSGTDYLLEYEHLFENHARGDDPLCEGKTSLSSDKSAI